MLRSDRDHIFDSKLIQLWATWRFVDPLPIREAALLLAGIDPGRVSWNRLVPEIAPFERALIGDIRMGRMNCLTPLKYEYLDEGGGDFEIVPCAPDSRDLCNRSEVSVYDLAVWADVRGHEHDWPSDSAGGGSDMDDLLNRKHPRYSKKLAAAILASREVPEPRGKHPKTAIREWLEQNAAKLGLLNAEGVPVAKALDEISAVVNWQDKGGAPKTPG